MQLKLNFALIAIAIASVSVSALPARGYASGTNDLAARAAAEDLAYLEARYGADIDVEQFFAREDEADLWAREDEADLYARDDEADLWAREDEADLWAREDDAEFYARDYNDWAELDARELTALAPAQTGPIPTAPAPPTAPAVPTHPQQGPAATPTSPTAEAHSHDHDHTHSSSNPFKPDASDADGMLGWKVMKAAMARSADPLPPAQEAAYTRMFGDCDLITDAALKKHCKKIVKNLKAMAGEQIWGFRHFLEQTSIPVPSSALADLSEIKPKPGHINTKLVKATHPPTEHIKPKL